MIKKIEDIKLLICCLKQFDTSAPIKISERIGSLGIYAQKQLQNAYNYYVESDGKIVGFISFYANYADTAYLTIIAVSGSHKGRGIGRNMLEHAIACAKERQMKYMRLEVHKKNLEAISFYKRNHFVMEPCYGESSYFMKREL